MAKYLQLIDLYKVFFRILSVLFFETWLNNLSIFLFQFHVGPWSGCSALCGEGVRTRKVTCYKKDAEGKITALEDEVSTPCESKKTPALGDNLKIILST